jgi:hypothetical protein
MTRDYFTAELDDQDFEYEYQDQKSVMYKLKVMEELGLVDDSNLTDDD